MIAFVLVFNYPEEDSRAEAMARQRAHKIRVIGADAYVRPRNPFDSYPSVEQIAKDRLAELTGLSSAKAN